MTDVLVATLERKTSTRPWDRLLKVACMFARKKGRVQQHRAERGKDGWCSGKVLTSHLCDPGSIPVLVILCRVEFVVGSFIALRVLLQNLCFSSLHKTNTSKFQFDLDVKVSIMITVLATEGVTLLKYQLLLLLQSAYQMLHLIFAF